MLLTSSDANGQAGRGGGVMCVALLLWLSAPHMEPWVDWRKSLLWRVRRSTVSHAICMSLFVAGFLGMVRVMPSVPAATRLGLIITLSTATIAFIIRAKTRVHKICTATIRIAEQLADDCRNVAAGEEADFDRMRQQSRELDRYLSVSLPTSFKIFGLTLLPNQARTELVHGVLLRGLEHPHRPPNRWLEASEDLDKIAAGLGRWADPAL
ncbi:hypothetical protein ABZW30_46010 [Kitasatospora sp. NPDC004669]|uniref:hypothetical protein n=1 Tax=Kitasatospora sp. NPDC004669 TaxID=3154555 RepID=UPI0033B67FD9